MKTTILILMTAVLSSCGGNGKWNNDGGELHEHCRRVDNEKEGEIIVIECKVTGGRCFTYIPEFQPSYTKCTWNQY